MNNRKKWLAQRRLVYSTLALFYRGELIKGLDILDKTNFLQQLVDSIDSSVFKSCTFEIISEIQKYKCDTKYVSLQLNEYQRLFVGPDQILAPLWESVYKTKDKIIFDENELEVRKIYNEAGLDVKKTEPADHLSLELAFMARLSVECSDFITVGTDETLAKQLEFLEKHLLKWNCDWVEKVIKNSSTKFWINLALITQFWLENDYFELENS